MGRAAESRSAGRVGVALRRAGTSLGPRQLAGRDGDVIELDIGTTDRLARDITSYGPSLGLLVKRILRETPELQRLRLSSIDAVEVAIGTSECCRA